MSIPTFSFQSRSLHQSLSKIRATGYIPGIIYGQSLEDAIPIQIECTQLLKVINTHDQSIFKFTLGDTTYDCILREFQTDALSSKILHADFQFVRSGEIINMSVPVRYEGLEILRAKKLLVETLISKIPVRGPVQNLPDSFIYPRDTCEHGFKLFAKTLPLPEATELLLNPETIIATVQ